MLELELFDLLEHTSDAAFTLTEQGEIASWNKSAEKLLGYSASEVLHKSCYEVLEGRGALGTHICRENCTILECVGHREEVPNFDFNVKRRDGQRIWLNVSTLVFHDPRTGRRLVAHLGHDITERKKTEEMAGRLVDASKQLLAAAGGSSAYEPVSPLSEQETAILRLFAEGKAAPAIARQLKISQQTLRNHLHHINQKLRTHNRLEAVMHAIQRKLI